MLEIYKKIYDEYLNNDFLTVQEACSKYNRSRSAFYKELKKENIELPKKKFFTTCSKDKLELAKKMYEDGKSIIKISKELNIGEKTLSKYLKHLEIPIKNNFIKQEDITYDKDFFDVINTEEKAYWFGFIMADGSVHYNSKNYRLTIEINNLDIKHLEKFKESLKSNICIKHRKNRDTCSITITNKKIVTDLSSKGCVKNKTFNGYIKNNIIPNDLIKDFLRGYLDGDGYISKDRTRIIFTIKSKIITDTIVEYIESIGVKCNTYYSNNLYRPTIEQKNSFNKFLHEIYDKATIFLDRKYETATKWICPSK